MKRILPIILILLLFAGCGGDGQEVTTAPTEAVKTGLYVPDSQLEQATAGAVRVYDLGQMQVDCLARTGDRLLLLSQVEDTTLTAISGAEGRVAATLTLPGQLTVWQSTNSGFAYYDTDHNQAVFLDPQLQEVDRFLLPEEITGAPLISPDGGQIFYFLGQELYALDTQMDVTRPVRAFSGENQRLTACHMGGNLLTVSLTDELEQERVIYISAQTGETLSTDQALLAIDSYDSTYLAARKDGSVTQYIFGAEGQAPKQMNITEDAGFGAAELNGVVGYGATSFSFYDLTSGKKTGAVSVETEIKLVQYLADRWSGCIWILTEDNLLLQWDPDKSAVTEDKVYSGPVYSAEKPDEAGLEALQERVDKLNRKHGVTIRIWNAAVKSNNGYDLEPEYQTGAIGKTLDQLESVLNELPENFLYKSVKRTIRICIVRTVNAQVDCAYYWFDKDPFIVISAGMDVRHTFLQKFAYVLDIHVLGKSPLVDQWGDLNPEGFEYGVNDYDGAWLEGETRAFADEKAMASVIDDRASVFYQAMQRDNAQMFQSETMQAKLLQLCKAIRDAWRLEQKSETYPWEQYLTESIAYKKS